MDTASLQFYYVYIVITYKYKCWEMKTVSLTVPVINIDSDNSINVYKVWCSVTGI